MTLRRKTTIQITLNIPDHCLLDQSPTEFGKRIKLFAALGMFQAGSISAG
jgi:hypothetical protein